MKKLNFIAVFLLVLLTSTSLFAMGAKEAGENEKLLKVESVTKTDYGYDIYGYYSDGTDAIYHVGDMTTSRFEPSTFTTGDYLYIKDNGMMTMSLPPQLNAVNIRKVTMGVNTGLIDGAIATPVEKPAVVETVIVDEPVTVEEVDVLSDLIPRFSYSYGYLTIVSLRNQGVVPRAGYFARGVVDAAEFADTNTTLYSIDDLNTYLDNFIANYYNNGIVTEPGPVYTTLEEIVALPANEDDVDGFSYSYGFLTTYELLFSGIDLEGESYIDGILDASYGNTPRYSEDEMNAFIEEYSTYLEQSYNDYIAAIAAENLQIAEEFLRDNSTKEGVVTLPSGVQYEITAEDAELGATPTTTDSVIVDYTLRLVDGSVMDQGSDVTFALTSLIPGFTEAVTNMKVGQSITTYIPPALGYGEYGTSNIAPNSLLIFDITLKGIITE